MKRKSSLLYAGVLMFSIVVNFSCQRSRQSIESADRSHPQTVVYDSAGVLSSSESKALFSDIHAVEKELGPQIAIIIISSLNGKNLEQYSLQNAEHLSLGRRQYKDGILITVAIDDKGIRIEVGFGLEKIIKDEIASRIIRNDIVPEFRERKYYDGLKAGILKLKALLAENKQLIGALNSTRVE